MSTTCPRGQRGTRLFVTTLAIVLAMCVSRIARAQFQREVESNNTPATANTLTSNPVKVTGHIYAGGDLDYYAFSVTGPCRVFCATMIANSAVSPDTIVSILAPDGVTVIETDDNDGTFSSSASSIAGATLPGAGTYFVRVTGSSAVSQIRPYDLYVRAHLAAANPEVEPNDAPPGQPMRSAGLVAGVLANAADVDNFVVPLNVGDTVFASLDLDPERDAVETPGTLRLLQASGSAITANDPGNAGPDSEAAFMTVNAAGNYVVSVTGTAAGTYLLSVSVMPAAACGGTTITQTANPGVAIADAAITSSFVIVPGNPRCGRVRVGINLNHASMNDLDIELLSPAGNVVSLFSDIGAAAQPQMNLVLDDEAAIPIAFNSDTAGLRYQPESSTPGGRLDYFQGVNGGGVWTLIIRDDLAGGGAGVLNSWTLEICADPLATCPAGAAAFDVYFSTFEAGNAGFTHSGVQDEWQRGTPTFSPLASAYSGINCWKTDLTGTYNLNSDQDLVSPPINLAGYPTPIRLRWAQRLHMESATFDHAWVEVRNPGGANKRRVWEWLGPSMNVSVGVLPTTVSQTIGWALMEADLSAYAGQTIEVVFHLDSDNAVNYAGMAVDDVRVISCITPTCAADVDHNGSVDTDDLLLMLGTWGACANCPAVHCAADIHPVPGGNCQIDTDDLLLLLGAWGNCP